jgi:ribosomal protein S18 acetylase RimI-like enzyme
VALVDQYARQAPGGRPLTAAARDALPDGLLKHASAVVFLAWRGDAAVGVAVCFRLFSTFAGRPLMNIHDIAVDEAHRGQGIGTQLLRAVEQAARESGCCKVTLEVREDNPAAEKLYRRFGFEDPGGAATRFLDKPLS